MDIIALLVVSPFLLLLLAQIVIGGHNVKLL